MNKESVNHVIPAILPKTFEELEQKLALITPLVPWVQIDAADGIFVPNKTWPYTEEEGGKDGAEKGRFAKIIKQEEAFPYFDEVSLEVDLMVSNPAFEADKWIAVGAARLVVHVQSIALDQFEILAKNIRDKGIALVLGVEMSLSLKDIHPYIVAAQENGELDGIQCMGIRREGFQHQEFDAEVLKKLSEIREAYPDIVLSVDGGVSLENAAELRDAGATKLICGSSVFDSPSPGETIEQLETILIS